MEARPWQTILPCYQVFVERLVLMPQNDNSQLAHDFRFPPDALAICQFNSFGNFRARSLLDGETAPRPTLHPALQKVSQEKRLSADLFDFTLRFRSDRPENGPRRHRP
jgi:hypothetical protein